MTLTSFKIERFLFFYISIDDKHTSSGRIVRNEHCIKIKISSSGRIEVYIEVYSIVWLVKREGVN